MADFAADWVDAFSDRPFGGNGCAVVHDAAHLDDATCMAFVRETSLVECTFIGPSETADFRVRYFLASREIPFAGHPTIATVASIVDRGFQGDTITLETLAGIIPVAIDRSGDTPSFTMTQIAPEFGPVADTELVAAAIGLTASDIVAPPQQVSTGLPFCITLIKDRATLQRAKLNVPALEELAASFGHDSTDMMEPFLVTLEGATDAGDTFARLLLAPPSPPEDPFTGSATGAMSAYLWHHSLIETANLTAEQGHDMGRPGQAKVQVIGPRDMISGVNVSGQAHILMRGQLSL